MRVFVELMSGSHGAMAHAPSAEGGAGHQRGSVSGRSACRCRRRSGESIESQPSYAGAANQWLMAGLERLCCGQVQARPGDNWLVMVGTAVSVAVCISLGNRYKL